ncbi:MAG: protein phosphatase CheZ [Melioribacteraceae bacterium]|nr:protein phosphatase CheZ [Melioribacteraceae bacterium]
MHQTEEMKQLNAKLNDLQSLFKLGEKIIPGIQKLIDFMVEIVPFLNVINSSIEESNKKIPKASHHLSDVTSATEIATTEILDRVDEIAQEVQQSENAFIYFKERYHKRLELLNKLKPLIENNREAVSIFSEIEELDNEANATQTLKKIETSIAKIKKYLENITMTLQVQDITAQQLSAVNHLIVEVQQKLSSLVMDLTDGELKLRNMSGKTEAPDSSHFDPNAKYIREDNAQELVDNLIKSSTSQEEIDKLFSNNGTK